MVNKRSKPYNMNPPYHSYHVLSLFVTVKSKKNASGHLEISTGVVYFLQLPIVEISHKNTEEQYRRTCNISQHESNSRSLLVWSQIAFISMLPLCIPIQLVNPFFFFTTNCSFLLHLNQQTVVGFCCPNQDYKSSLVMFCNPGLKGKDKP